MITEIFTSAAKIVFLMLAFTACIGLFVGKIEPKDFMVLAMAAFSFYFAMPSNEANAGSAGK